MAPLELRLPEPLALSESAEVALEDYAREVARSERAEALRGGQAGAPVEALRLFGLAAEPAEEARRDILAFARALADAGQGSGLGWS
jgi:hypothetical protein